MPAGPISNLGADYQSERTGDGTWGQFQERAVAISIEAGWVREAICWLSSPGDANWVSLVEIRQPTVLSVGVSGSFNVQELMCLSALGPLPKKHGVYFLLSV